MPLDLIWGAKDIAQAIGRSTRQVNYMLETGALPARKVAGRWCVSRRTLVSFFNTEKEAA